MLRLTEKDLSDATKKHLASLQKQIDGVEPFEEKATLAAKLWDNKSISKKGKTAFDEIKKVLFEMCVGKGLCNYCEHNEASDIEHIAPKSLFPQWAFSWSNFLLACKNCNTGYKIDSMYVFSTADSCNAVYVERGTKPVTDQIAFLNPRIENPMDFMELAIMEGGEIADFFFYARPPHIPNTQGYLKVECTLKILSMKEKRSLHHHRQTEFDNFTGRLRKYVGVKNAKTHDEINEVTSEVPKAQFSKNFETAQLDILQAIQTDILTADHPTVWQEMIRQRKSLPAKIQSLFDQVPELIAATIRQ